MRNAGRYLALTFVFLLAAATYSYSTDLAGTKSWAGGGTGTLSGKVYDKSTNSAISGAKIRLKYHGVVSYTESDSSGQFSYSSLQNGEFRITVTQSGYVPYEGSVTVKDDTGSASIGLEVGYSYSGSVTDESSGSAIEGAYVGIKSSDGQWKLVKTDSSGAYSFSSVASGDYTLAAVKYGYNRAEKSISISADVTDGDIQLETKTTEATYSYAGTVTDSSSGSAIEDVYVGLKSSDGRWKIVKTDSSGAFSFSSVKAGDYTLAAMKKGYERAESSVTISASVTGASITLTAKASETKYSYSGTVTDKSSGSAIEDAYVGLKSSDGRWKTVKTDSSGAFTISDVKAGDYTLAAKKNGYERTESSVTISASVTGASITLQAETTYSVSGTITDKSSGSAIEGAYVGVMGAREAKWKLVQTDSSGKFTITGVTAGSYKLASRKEGYKYATKSITVSDADVTDADMQLETKSSGSMWDVN